MWPVLFRLGPIDITSFGAMVATGALVGLWVFRRELARSGLPDAAVDAAIFGLLGGLIGAKLLYVFEHLKESPFLSLLFDRGGMSWFGGFVGGLTAGYLTIRRHGGRSCRFSRPPLRRWRLVRCSAGSAASWSATTTGRPTTLPLGGQLPRGPSPNRRPRPSDAAVRGGFSRPPRMGADSAGAARGSPIASSSVDIFF